jgi:16S rRNA U1498 N3-methylase RsmE
MWRARLASIDREGVRCLVLEPAAAAGLLDLELAFGVAAKGRTLWLIEKSVELGAAALQPLELARSASVADAARSPAFWRKAERRAAAALMFPLDRGALASIRRTVLRPPAQSGETSP